MGWVVVEVPGVVNKGIFGVNLYFQSRVTRLFNPLCRSVGPSICPSVRHTLLFLGFVVFGLTAPAQMIK